MTTFNHLISHSKVYSDLSKEKLDEIEAFCAVHLVYFEPVRLEFVSLLTGSRYKDLNYHSRTEIAKEVLNYRQQNPELDKDIILDSNFKKIEKWLLVSRTLNLLWVISIPLLFLYFQSRDLQFVWLSLIFIYLPISIKYNRRLASLNGGNYIDVFNDEFDARASSKIVLQFSSFALITIILTIIYLDYQIWWALPLAWLVLVRGLVRYFALNLGSTDVKVNYLTSFVKVSIERAKAKVWSIQEVSIEIVGLDIEFSKKYFEVNTPIECMLLVENASEPIADLSLYIYVNDLAYLDNVNEEWIKKELDKNKIIRLIENPEVEFAFFPINESTYIVLAKEDYWGIYSFSGTHEVTLVKPIDSGVRADVEKYKEGILVET
tara:strand:+ start:87465 stop:88595 length:1131 start_codon:yes stop_codon:yes gene_type:complete